MRNSRFSGRVRAVLALGSWVRIATEVMIEASGRTWQNRDTEITRNRLFTKDDTGFVEEKKGLWLHIFETMRP